MGIKRKKSVQLNNIIINDSNKEVNLNNFSSSNNNDSDSGKLNKKYKPILTKKMQEGQNYL